MTIATGQQALAADVMAIKRWTLNKLRVGAGAGADPTEIDVPTGAKSYYQTRSSDSTNTGGIDSTLETFTPTATRQFVFLACNLGSDGATATAKIKITWDDDTTTTLSATNENKPGTLVQTNILTSMELIGEGLHKRIKQVEFIEKSTAPGVACRWKIACLEV